MSTLATTNIKHPSSASNNIVLDSAGGVDLDALTVSGSAPADSVNIDASGNLLVGTSSASGSNFLQVNSDALINGNTVGRGNNSGVTNTALGNVALAANDGNNQNTAVGEQALKTNTSGARNTAVGKNALRDCITSTNNTAIGVDALLQIASGAVGNTAVGDQAGQAITTGDTNVVVGYKALDAMTIGNDAVAIGYDAFAQFNRTGDTSTPGVAIGSGAGSAVTTAYNNTIIGTYAGASFTTGVFGVYIGHSTTASAGGATDEMVIGTRGGTGKGNNTGFINPNTGGVYQGNNSSSWSTTSDRRLKKNIVDNTEGLDIINQVRVVNFEYRLPEEIEETELQGQALVKRNEDDEITGLQGVKLGVIAQELQQVCSDCVTEETTGVLSVVDDSLFWHLINAVKELSAQNAALEARLTALESA
jgi:trimeric autotransporter adhesin